MVLTFTFAVVTWGSRISVASWMRGKLQRHYQLSLKIAWQATNCLWRLRDNSTTQWYFFDVLLNCDYHFFSDCYCNAWSFDWCARYRFPVVFVFVVAFSPCLLLVANFVWFFDRKSLSCPESLFILCSWWGWLFCSIRYSLVQQYSTECFFLASSLEVILSN